MGNIQSVQLVANPDGDKFMKNVTEIISSFQGKNLEVEIQYGTACNSSLSYFSALIIGRVKEKQYGNQGVVR